MLQFGTGSYELPIFSKNPSSSPLTVVKRLQSLDAITFNRHSYDRTHSLSMPQLHSLAFTRGGLAEKVTDRALSPPGIAYSPGV